MQCVLSFQIAASLRGMPYVSLKFHPHAKDVANHLREVVLQLIVLQLAMTQFVAGLSVRVTLFAAHPVGMKLAWNSLWLDVHFLQSVPTLKVEVASSRVFFQDVSTQSVANSFAKHGINIAVMFGGMRYVLTRQS